MIQQWQSRGWNCTDFSQILTMCQCISSSTGCSIREKGSCPRETTTLSSIVGSFDLVALIGWQLHSIVTSKNRQFSGQIHKPLGFGTSVFHIIHYKSNRSPWAIPMFRDLATDQWQTNANPLGRCQLWWTLEDFEALAVTVRALFHTFPACLPSRWWCHSMPALVPDCQHQGGMEGPGSSEHVFVI